MGMDLGAILAANTSVPFTAVDFCVGLTFTPYMITDNGGLWLYNTSNTEWDIIDVSDFGKTYPIAFAISITDELWVVTSDGSVWQGTTYGGFTEIAANAGATDISVGMDGSVWISRVDPTGKGVSDVA